MNSTYRNDHRTQDLYESEEREREISLGTATVLGIFFGLALICAVFFGFGYSMGRHSAQSLASSTGTAAAATEEGTGGSKPAPGSLAKGSASASHQNETPNADETAEDSSKTTAPAVVSGGNMVPAVAVARPVASTANAAQSAMNPAIKAVSLGRPVAAPAAPPVPVAAPGVGTILVQVAAVSHQEDANVLVNALKKRGYTVAVRQVPQDKLLHIQLGPFATKKDADVMKQRLLADGYNAIVK